MNKPVDYVIRYRIYCYIGRQEYYCNRSTSGYRWDTRNAEYPDHYDIVEAARLMNRYSHLMPHMQEIPVVPGDDE